MRAQRESIVFSIILTAIFCIILQGCAVTKSESCVSESDVRELLTTMAWGDNIEIEQLITVLEWLDENKLDKARKHLQEVLYVRIGVPPGWEELELEYLEDTFMNPDALKAERLKLLKRIKKYHEKHKNEINMRFPSNRRAVLQLERIELEESQ